MASELVRQGNVVWDIGSNVGLFAFAAAGLAGPSGRVVAVEPDDWLVGLLRRTAALSPPNRAPVTVLPAAVSDSQGLAQLHIAARGRSANYLENSGSSQAGGFRARSTVLTVTLDWLLQHLPAPDVLKIDVEGMEYRVLRGAEKLLSEVRPRVWCEVSHKNVEEVTHLLQAANYDLYDASAAFSAGQPVSKAVWDTLAIARTSSPI
jgi:FkbM family methyltransferase